MIAPIFLLSIISVLIDASVEPVQTGTTHTIFMSTLPVEQHSVVPSLPIAPVNTMVSGTPVPTLLATATGPAVQQAPMENQQKGEESLEVVSTATAPPQWRRPVIVPEGISMAPEDRRGNWYDKRQILSQARTVYEQIRGLVAKVEGQQQGFINRQRSLSKQIAALYIDLGFEQGKVDEIFTNLMTELGQERITQGQLTEEERKLLAEIEEKKKLLQELHDDTAMLSELEGAVDKAVSTMIEQLELCRSYEQKAWEHYDKIDNVLNEKIAQQLYLEMQSYAEHITAIDAYLRGALTQYIEKTAQSMRTYMQKIQRDVDDLQQRGIILSAKVAEEQKAAAEARKREEEERKKREQVPVVLPQPWWKTVIAPFVTAWYTVVDSFSRAVMAVTNFFSKQEDAALVVPKKRSETDSVVTKT